MFFTIEKLEKRTRELEGFRYVDMTPITPLTSMEGDKGYDEIYIAPPSRIDGPSLNLGDEFIGRDRYLWAQEKLTLPESRAGFEVAGLFDFGRVGSGHCSGFESLLYVDGEPYQAVDTNHGDVIFEKLAGQTVELTFLLWTGLDGMETGKLQKEIRHRISCASIGYLHKATDTFYYLSKAIYKTIKLLPDTSSEKHGLTAALDAAYKLINWDEDKFHRTIETALDCLETALGKIEKHTDITVNVIGHTHIDVAWLWRIKHTHEKTLRSFTTVLRLMEEFDEYVFLQTQPQLYKYIKADCPALYEKIKARIAEGRWEVDGAMWVEADCNLSSGEALARQLMHGAAFFRDELGVRSEYLWLPDVFGYSWALPQLLKLAGIKTFMTTKISWNQYNSIPHDLFRWRGIDGTEILTYFITTPQIGYPIDSRFSTYNGLISPRSVLGSWQKFKDKPVSNETLLCYGYGDGGGGVNRNMLNMRRAMDKLPGLPNVKPSTARDFFRKMHDHVEKTEQYVHTWDGELYLEYHRGTYTAQANNKKQNRRMEYALAQCEWLACLTYLADEKYPSARLYDAWETVLLQQFHDIIPGSSIREVHEDSDKAYAILNAEVEQLENEALDALLEPTNDSFTIYHSGSFKRNELVLLPVQEDGVFEDSLGNALPSQKTKDGWLVNTELEPLSMTTVTFKAGQPPKDGSAFAIDMAAGKVDTPLYAISWNKAGRLDSIYDKANNRQVLAGEANLLEIYEDKPLEWDNWDIDIFHTEKCELVAVSKPPKLVENGSERAVIRFEYAYNLSTITQDMTLYRSNGRIDFVTHVDWHESGRLLKAAFPVDIRSTKATYDIQFGHVERPTHWNTSWDLARFEVVGHKWADLSEAGYGVSLLNDCKYGYAIKGNIMRITLLKSTKMPDPEMDMGAHEFTYSLLPHAGTAADGNTIEESIKLNLPVRAVPGALKNEYKSLVHIDCDAVIIDALKKAEKEDCIVLRIHECRGGRHKLKITSGFGIKAFVPCNLLEENLADPVHESEIMAEIKPFEIQTFKLWF